LFDTVAWLGSNNWISAGTGSASLSIDQTDNKNVKSQFRISAVPNPETGDIDLSVPRAYVKFRFPKIRSVIGKAPFSWGEGLIFNAGDVIFGDTALSTNLMQTEFLDSDAWLTTIYYSLGNFSYIEAIVLPPEDILDDSNNVINGFNKSMGGGRLVTRLGNTKLESGYIYDGRVYAHKPYLTLQGNLYLDWHLSASVSLPDGYALTDSIEDNLVITAGIYSLASIGYDGILNYRLEAMIKPFEKWEEYSAGSGQSEVYGIYLYPELAYSVGSGMALILRSFISPVDMSAAVIPGFSWNVFQGFNLLGFATFGIGDPGDTYAWEPESVDGSGFALMIGVSVIY
ncbi:MAG: hypothetical protein KAR21_06145, partial [Spirochaetales bacterium]|nr:hypothetical protein [Spirochaetales bacterium]